jgi:hypothetical protein
MTAALTRRVMNSRRSMRFPREEGHARKNITIQTTNYLTGGAAAHVRFSNRPFGVKHFQTVHVAVC